MVVWKTQRKSREIIWNYKLNGCSIARTSEVQGGVGTAHKGLCGCMYEIVLKFIARYQLVPVQEMNSGTVDNDGHINFKMCEVPIFRIV